MDAFLEPFWNLDQIRGWAETRDPDIIRAAAGPRYGQPRKTLEIAVRTTHMATGILRDGRDIDCELWAASGWAPKIKAFDPPPMVQDYAEKHGRPAYLAYRYKDLQVHWPLNPKARALARAWTFASEQDRELVVEITVDHYEDLRGALDDDRLKKLPPSFAHLLRDAVLAPAVEGPPHVYIREPFRTLDYMEYLFRSGRLQAVGNRPNNPEAIEITPIDWGGLEIAVGGDQERLSVWMRGQIRMNGRGDFENVRVARDQILREFPGESPTAADWQIDGRAYAPSSPREAIAAGIVAIHQATDRAGAPGLTVAETLLLDRFADGRSGFFVSPDSIRRRAAAIAERAGFSLALDRDFADIGPAERQLVAIARALSADARVLIFDEPTASLSSAEAARLFDVIEALAAKGP